MLWSEYWVFDLLKKRTFWYSKRDRCIKFMCVTLWCNRFLYRNIDTNTLTNKILLKKYLCIKYCRRKNKLEYASFLLDPLLNIVLETASLYIMCFVHLSSWSNQSKSNRNIYCEIFLLSSGMYFKVKVISNQR